MLTITMDVIGKWTLTRPYSRWISPGSFPNQFSIQGANCNITPMITNRIPKTIIILTTFLCSLSHIDPADSIRWVALRYSPLNQVNMHISNCFKSEIGLLKRHFFDMLGYTVTLKVLVVKFISSNQVKPSFIPLTHLCRFLTKNSEKRLF